MKKLYPILLLLASCAQIVSPSGGPKDETPPAVVSTNPENKTINFNKTKIEIKFNEYVDIKNPEQIVISPYIKEKPVIESEGKTILIDLKKSILEKDKTYTINFGNSIVDNHEGKNLENFSYCFSTGSYIDSMQIQGKIVNAKNLKPEKGITIGLYPIENFEDSTPIKTYPSYLSQSNEIGNFSINNLPSSEFFLFAFNDENKDLKYQKIESVAFEITPVKSGNTTEKLDLFLSESQLHDKNKILDTLNTEPGLYSLAIYTPTNIEFVKSKEDVYYKWQHNENQIDTLFIFSKNKPDSGSSVFQLKINGEVKNIPIKNRKRLKNKTLEFKTNRDIAPNDSIIINSNYPVNTLKAEMIKVKRDSIYLPFELKENDPFTWILQFKKQEGKMYELIIEDSITTDIWNRPNKELKANYLIKNSKETGTLALNIINPNKEDIIVQIVSTDEKENILAEFNSRKSETIQLSYLSPAEVKIKVIKDLNKNGKWDRANWLEKKQAEPIAYLEQKLTIRAFWDIEQSLDLQKIFAK